MSHSGTKRPVIIITGSNSGAGFGLAQRLLVQLSSPTPPDTLPTHPQLLSPTVKPVASPFSAADGCILILACRNAIKAHRARAQLQSLLRYLEDLPDEAETPTSVPAKVLAEALETKINGMIDEDADPALVAQAMEASLRRRRRRTAAVSLSSEGTDEERDLTRDSKSGRVYTLLERETKARGRYRRQFCANTVIEIQALDLGSMASTLTCAKEITARHGYVTHVVMNAGSSAFTGINWPYAISMMIVKFHYAVTYPQYKLQRSGDIGKDGYGWVWQANIGAHYILARALLPALRSTPYSTPSRIIWTGSMEALEDKYDPTDLQCIKTPKPYESSKYQCELAALGLEDLLKKSRLRTQPGTPLPLAPGDDASYTLPTRSASGKLEPTSYLSHPGVVASSIFAECLNLFLSTMMKVAFYIARYTFSKHHNIDAYKGAVAASHLALAPANHLDPSKRYGSQSDFWAREYVHASRVDGWYRNTPSGMGAKAKGDVVALSAKAGLQSEEGAYVRSLSRDLLVRLEGIAKKVWKEAREGALPPFTQIDDDGFQADDGKDSEKIKEDNLKPNTVSDLQGKEEKKVDFEGVTSKDESISSQESWERVDGAI